MRAWLVSARGPPTTVLKLTTTLPTPTPQPTQLLIRISHAALNPGSKALMLLIPQFLRASPSIPEIDFAGTVVAAGASAPSQFPIGTRVFGCLHLKSMAAGKGVLADYIAINSEEGGVAVLPASWSFEQGAGLACCAITALNMCRASGMREGERVLVNGASGGVGTMAVQVARAMGAGEVVAVCSGRNAEMVRGLGADEVIDYQAHHPVGAFLEERFKYKPFDRIFDAVGVQALYSKSPRYLKEDGVFVNVGGYEGDLRFVLNGLRNRFLPRWLGGTPRKYIGISTPSTNESAATIAGFAAEGKVKTIVEKVFNLEDVLEAYKLLESQRARGKIIIRIQDSDKTK
ncbi:NAD(P)-binding protein [Mytilinidion resinicola]|uniref:NAD(P)-binding protein n=1 Tax=Mytilinidion resinicola TaxID=574789 RepID=A0A6A6YWK2_9PEZI|nr:NAD(P)-binding protein [Mytilinidion resinicola]KAF2812277.1 NAD(P)-binding protein [Mytilinidion resinicola]